jgi:hypothetical protein
MPITRRRRATPPDQPENNNHVDQGVNAVNADNAADTAGATSSEQPGGAPTDNANDNSVVSPVTPASSGMLSAPMPYQASSVTPTPSSAGNGDRGEHGDRQEYVPLPPAAPETTGRRTSFRRPMQTQAALPPVPPVSVSPAPPVVAQPPMPNPTHEIALPLGNLLHLAYNPSYTGSSEARTTLLHKLAQETKAGGRARCWNCGSLAIAYDHWSTRSKNFGEVGVAFCEICGVWSVM